MESKNSGQTRKTGNSAFCLLLRGGALVASWWLTHLGYRRMVRQEVEQLRGDVREQMRRLTELERTLAGMAGKTADTAIDEAAALAPHAAETGDEITPERMALIAAVVTAFLGRKVKIHQARLVSPAAVSPWAQQGRVFVQASHALARH
jgi:hypothetical protein